MDDLMDFFNENEGYITAVGAMAANSNAARLREGQRNAAAQQQRDNVALRSELEKQEKLLKEQNISNVKRLKIEEGILAINRDRQKLEENELSERREEREQVATEKEQIRKIRNFMADTIISFEKLKRQNP